MKFSVVTAVFNAESVLEDTLKSVQNQQVGPEQILVDNCSSDHTLEIARKAVPGIRVISEPDRGIYDAMNKGAAAAQGEILSFLNAGDRYPEGTLQTVERLFQENPQAELIHGHISVNGKDYAQPRGIASFHGARLYHPAVFMKKQVFDRLGGFDLSFRICADLDLFLRAKKAGIIFLKREEIFTEFALGGVSVTRGQETAEEVRKVLLKNGSSPTFARFYYLCMRSRQFLSGMRKKLSGK